MPNLDETGAVIGSSHRPYRPGHGIEAGLGEIERMRGVLYDVAVVDAWVRLFREKGFEFG